MFLKFERPKVPGRPASGGILPEMNGWSTEFFNFAPLRTRRQTMAACAGGWPHASQDRMTCHRIPCPRTFSARKYQAGRRAAAEMKIG